MSEATAQVPREKLDSLYLHAEYDTAISIINRQLASEPSPPAVAKLLLHRCQCRLSQQRMESAKEDCRQALQLLEPMDSDEADLSIQAYLNLATAFRTVGPLDSATTFLRQAEQLIRRYDRHHSALAAESTFIKGYLAQKEQGPEEALSFLLEAERLFRKNKNIQQAPTKYIICLSTIGQLYSRERKKEQAREYFQRAEEVCQQWQLSKHPLRSSIYNSLGIMAFREKNYSDAIRFGEKAYAIIRSKYGKEHTQAGILLNNLGAAYAYKGDLYRSLTYWEAALDIKKSQLGAEHISVGNTYINLSSFYERSRQFDKGLEATEKALVIFQRRYGLLHPQVAGIHHIRAGIFRQLGLQEEALKSHDQSLAILKEILPPKDPEIAQSLFRKANSLFFFERYQAAASLFEEALFIVRDNQDLNFLEKNAYKANYARALGQLGRHEEAQALWDDSLIALDDLLFGQYPRFSQFEALYNYALYLEAKALQQPSVEHWSAALAVIKKAKNQMEELQAELSDEESVRRLRQNYYRLYEALLLSVYELFQLTQQPEYLQQCFQYMEDSKSFSLLAAANTTDIPAYRSIPESMLLQEKEFKEQIAYWEEQKYHAHLRNNHGLLSRATSALRSNKEALYFLWDRYQEEYPDFYALRYQPPLTEVTAIQKALQKEEGMLSFFMGEQHLFSVLIRPDGIQIDKQIIPKETESRLRSFHEGLHQASAPMPEEQAVQLYNLLLAPVEPLPKRLMIIPDSYLWYVPFEALLKKEPASGDFFKAYPFLLYEHIFSYNYSAGLWLEMRQKEQTNTKVLAIAPSFTSPKTAYEGLRSPLKPLLFNEREAKHIKEITGGDVLLSEQADRAVFLEKAPDYGIFHFATHATLDPLNHDFSFLAFSNGNALEDSTKLSIHDLYQLDLPAQMVVLSACQTGLGPLQKGAGMASLARSFAFAGAKSIVPSLWQVNDQATAEVMSLFYQNLKKGMPKDQALQEAKIDFLQHQVNNKAAHPYYWAGFLLMGDMDPVSFDTTTSLPALYWWLLGPLLLLIFYFFKKTFPKR